ncbi:MAG: Coq4 family protein [Nannocystaceae bacterium]
MQPLALLHDAREVLAATLRVLRDSTRTEDIHRVEEITGRARVAELVGSARAGDPSIADLLRDRPVFDATTVDFEALRRLPAESLGGAYVRHLDDHGIEVHAAETSDEFIADADARYLIYRYRQTHDVWHVLVGVGIAGHEEVLIHAFAYGQVRLPVSAMIMALGGVKHLVLEGRWLALRRGLLAAYRSGRDADPLLGVRWEALWDRDLDEVRRRFGVRPLPPAITS